MIAKRIAHKGNCQHAQTPYARRVCRKAMVAASTTAVTTPTYANGDIVDLGTGSIELILKRGFASGAEPRWHFGWSGEPYGSAVSYATAEDAITAARVKLTGPRCSCGAPATMNASLRPTCDEHYDRYAA